MRSKERECCRDLHYSQKNRSKAEKTASKDWSPARWHTLIMLALRNDKQDDQEFKASLGYVKPHLNKQTKEEKKKILDMAAAALQVFMRP